MATPYMNLVLPVVSQTIGPTWATQLNAALALIDSHNHSSSQGVQIPTAGLNINADLPFNGQDAIQLRSARFTDQGGTIAAAGDVGCLYIGNGNLYYNNGAGTAVQVTNGGSVAGAAGNITGLAAPAALTYTSGSTTFRFTSNTNIDAALDCGPVTIRQQIASANGITLQSPSGLAASYALTLLTALPAGQRIMTCDAAGNLAAAWNVDGTTILVSSNILSAANVTQSTANSSATIKGNRSAADAGADVVLASQATRTAGYLFDVENPLGTQAASLRYDGELSAKNVWHYVTLTSSQSTSSSVPQNITGFSFPVENGASYEIWIEWIINYNYSSTATFDYAISAPTVTTGQLFTEQMIAGSTIISRVGPITGLGTGVGVIQANTGGGNWWGFSHALALTFTASGTAQVQFYMAAASTGTITIQPGTTMRYRRIDATKLM